MRIVAISLVMLILAPASWTLADDAADQAKRLREGSESRDGQAIDIMLFARDRGWIIVFRRDGSVQAQYGSSFGDSGSQPKGTVAFSALLKAVARLKSDKQIENGSQVAIHRTGEGGATAFYLKDDTLFRYLMESYEKTWKPDIGGSRFPKLLKKYPIYPNDNVELKLKPPRKSKSKK